MSTLREVLDLSTGASFLYTCSPEDAVIAAYAQNVRRDHNTADYRERYGHLLQHGKYSVSCGDYACLTDAAKANINALKHARSNAAAAVPLHVAAVQPRLTANTHLATGR